MKKVIKVSLIVILSLVIIVAIGGFLGWRYLQNTFLSFEGDYKERTTITELTKDGYTFLDRNDNGELDAYEDDRNTIAVRVADVLSQMTMEEKIHLLKGSGIASAAGMVEEGEGIPGAVGTIVPTPRLGLPTVYLSDGPAGLRIQPRRPGEDRTYYCTAFPIASMLASTWNETLVQEVGIAMGNEALEYGLDVILGPGVNIHRHPLCGRNFEYYSEDPLLTGNIGAAMVNGIESNGIGTSIKHFVANNQETERFLNDSRVSERALREIYLKGFEIIVKKAQPWTIMSSYNKVNGTYTSESEYLLTEVLRDDWKFEGLVMSDWFGGRNAPNQIIAGNDLLEPGTKKQWNALIKAQEKGELSSAIIDRAVSRILSLILRSKKMQQYDFGNHPDLEAHANITRQSAAEGIVLLKNNATLPIDNRMKVALLGTTSYDFIAGGTGSGDVNEAYTISLEEGLINAGFKINETARGAFEAYKEANKEAFIKPEGFQAMFNPYSPPQMEYSEEQLNQIVATSDIGIITIGRNAGEGGDRIIENDFELSDIEQNMIKTSCKAFHDSGKKVVVVLNIGGVIETASWKEQPDAIVLAWQGGQEGGNSVADIMSGVINPSGKLPMTFPIQIQDHAAHTNFPMGGQDNNLGQNMMNLIFGAKDRSESEQKENIDFTDYEEGIYVGYRHFDKANLDVSYPFGYGLSYTNFEYSNIQVLSENDSIMIAFDVQNIGEVKGKEVVQIYISPTSSAVDRPKQELKAFAKTNTLEPNATQRIQMHIPSKELSYWDESTNSWQLEKGIYMIKAAASSRDIRLSAEIVIE